MLFVAVAIGVFVAAFPIWLLIRAAGTGVWSGRGTDVSRDERPVAFWFGVLMYGVIAAVVLSTTAYFAFAALS